MGKFEEASKLKLRFATVRGMLVTEDLWDLSLNHLDALAVSLEEEVTKTKRKSFLKKESKESEETKLGFDIVVHILKTKIKEDEKRREAGKRKIEKEKLLDILGDKQDESLRNLSEKELKDKIKELE